MHERFSGLDLLTKAKLLEEIAALATERRVTVVLVTHDPMEATSLCRSVMVLGEGHVEEAGALNDLLRAPQSELLAVFRAYLPRATLNS